MLYVIPVLLRAKIVTVAVEPTHVMGVVTLAVGASGLGLIVT